MIDKSFLHYLSYRIFVQMRGLLQQYTIVIYYSSMLLQYSSTPIFDLRADRDAVRLAYYYSSILAREAPAIWLDEHMYVIIGKDKRGKKVTQTAIKNTENRKNDYIAISVSAKKVTAPIPIPNFGRTLIHLQGVPSIGTHFRFKFLTFLMVLSKKANYAILTHLV